MPNYDYKQISALEKAIEEKYGQQAILNPSDLWTPEKEKVYLDQVRSVEKYYRQQPHEQCVDQGGFIMKEKLVNKNNFKNCLLCNKQAYKSEDEIYMQKFNSCFRCYILKIEGRTTNGRNSK